MTKSITKKHPHLLLLTNTITNITMLWFKHFTVEYNLQNKELFTFYKRRSYLRKHFEECNELNIIYRHRSHPTSVSWYITLFNHTRSFFSQRLYQICCNIDRYRRSSLFTAISIYNNYLKTIMQNELQLNIIFLCGLKKEVLLNKTESVAGKILTS